MTIRTTPISRPALIAALAGDDLEAPVRCRTCNGTGSIRVGAGRGRKHTCPMCRGAKVRPYPAPAPGAF